MDIKKETFKKLIPILELNIKKYHELFDIPLKAEYFENILYKSFLELNIDTHWNSMSHTISCDMTNDIFGRISCKSGNFKNIKKKNQLVLILSSSRTTKHKTLDDKIKFMNTKKEDSFFCLTNSKEDKSYKLLYFESDMLNINNVIWKVDNIGWKGNRTGLDIEIRKSMSDQIWYILDNKQLEHTLEHTLNKKLVI